MDELKQEPQQYYVNERNYEKLRFLDFQQDLRVCKECGCVVHETKLDIHNKLHSRDQYSEG